MPVLSKIKRDDVLVELLEIISLCDQIVLTGGTVLYTQGLWKTFGDIDLVFPTDKLKKEFVEHLEHLGLNPGSDNNFSYKGIELDLIVSHRSIYDDSKLCNYKEITVRCFKLPNLLRAYKDQIDNPFNSDEKNTEIINKIKILEASCQFKASLKDNKTHLFDDDGVDYKNKVSKRLQTLAKRLEF